MVKDIGGNGNMNEDDFETLEIKVPKETKPFINVFRVEYQVFTKKI